MGFAELIQQLANGLVSGSVYILVALGLTLIFGILQIPHFAHGSVAMLGGYTSFLSIQFLGIGPFLSLIISMPIAALIGIGIERFLYRPVRDAPLINSFIIALGLLMVIDNSAEIVFGERQVVLQSKHTDVWTLGPVTLTSLRVYIVVACVVLVGALLYLVHRTKLGSAIRATAQNRDAAAMVGVNVNRVSSTVFAVGSALAAAAGAFIGALFSISPHMGEVLMLKGFAVMILGGMGSILGAVVGGATIGILESFGGALISSAYRDVWGFLAMILVLTLKPSGLFGSQELEH